MTIEPEITSLAGRVAVVTGAAKGIGESLALSLAAFGADLAVCDRDAEGLATTVKAIEARGRRAWSGVFDVRHGEDVEAWVAGLPELHILVNNAGGGFVLPFMTIRPKGQTALVDENFTSVTHFVRACAPKMTSGGSIINITSVEAFRASPGFSVYGAMKAAVEHLTRTLALELAPLGIRVNCVAPDAISTPGDEELAAAMRGDEPPGEPPDGPHEYGARIPLGWGQIDDCAGAVVFLASNMSRFVTGSTVHVDGGTNAARGWHRRVDGAWEP